MTTIDITEHFSAQDWDAGNGPLSSAFLDHHGFEDVTTDERWFDRFEASGHRLGCYADSDDQYWIVYYDEPNKGYNLEWIGSEEDLLAHLGIDDPEAASDLVAKVPPELMVDGYEVTTLAAVRREYEDVEHNGHNLCEPQLSDDSPVLVLAGWFATDDNYEVQEAAAESGLDAAERYFTGGAWEWSQSSESISVQTYRAAYCIRPSDDSLLELKLDPYWYSIGLDQESED